MKKGDCSNWFGASYYIPLSLSGISMLVSIVFGIGLYKKIIEEHSKALLENDDSSELVVFKQTKQHSNLKKQIKTILVTYFFTIFAEVCLNTIRELIVEDTMKCSNDFIFSSIKNEAEIFLFLFTLIEITPCLIVPYVFYYVPFSKAYKRKAYH